MKISFVVALTRAGVMGKNNALPWHLPEDLKHFKALTLGKAMLMGRKTFDSIGRPLPGRRTIVLSRQADLKIPGVECVTTVAEALKLCAGAEELCVVGGAEIFRLVAAEVDTLHITWIEKEFSGDIFFPQDFPWKNFREVKREEHREGEIPFSYVDYQRL